MYTSNILFHYMQRGTIVKTNLLNDEIIKTKVKCVTSQTWKIGDSKLNLKLLKLDILDSRYIWKRTKIIGLL